MSIESTAPVLDEASVLADLTALLHDVLADAGLDEAPIGMETTFHDELELESIDLVELSGKLRVLYGERVNFARFIAERELDEIIALTVGELVRYVVNSLREFETAGR